MGCHLGERSQSEFGIMMVSCCNQVGGLWSRDSGLIAEGDYRGMAQIGSRLYVLSRDTLLELRDGTLVPIWEAAGQDWHGLGYCGKNLWIVDPVSDMLFEIDLDGNFVGKHRYKGDEGSRLHTNDICFHEGDMYQSSFCWGICRNGQQLGFGAGVQPHSPTFAWGELHWCASAKGEVMRNDQPIHHEEGFPRGMAYDATRDVLWVGYGKNRHKDGRTFASIVAIDFDGKVVEQIDLPTSETYAICL